MSKATKIGTNDSSNSSLGICADALRSKSIWKDIIYTHAANSDVVRAGAFSLAATVRIPVYKRL